MNIKTVKIEGITIRYVPNPMFDENYFDFMREHETKLMFGTKTHEDIAAEIDIILTEALEFHQKKK